MHQFYQIPFVPLSFSVIFPKHQKPQNNFPMYIYIQVKVDIKSNVEII